MTPTPAPIDGERVEELLREAERDLAKKLGLESRFRGANRAWEYPDDVAPGMVESAINNLLASLSEAEARAERLEKERDGAWEAVKRCDIHIDELNAQIVEDAAERSRSSRVIEAAQKVAEALDTEESNLVVVGTAIDLRAALAAALEDAGTTTEEGAEDG